MWIAADRRRGGDHAAAGVHLMLDAVWIAAIRHRRRKPRAYAHLAFRCAQKQQAAVGRLGAAVEIDCEFLAADRWQIEGERRIVGHGGCGVGWDAQRIRLDNASLSEPRLSRHCRHQNFRCGA